MASYNDFLNIDIRVGEIIEVEDFPEAVKPMFKIKIDFGEETGIKKSCAQLKKNYTKETLLGKLVLGVVNFPPKKIGPDFSEVLILGLADNDGSCVLIAPDKEVPLGGVLR